MKANRFIAAALAIVMGVACTPKSAATAEAGAQGDSTATQKPVNPKTLLPSKALTDSVSYLIGINFGSFIKGYNFGDVNYAQIKKGIEDFIKCQVNPRDSSFASQFKIDPNEMNDIFNAYLAKRTEYTTAVNVEKERKFLAENAKKAGVQTTASGLQYIIENPGSDTKIGPQDTVYVHYKGTLTDGTVFDQTPEGGEAVKMQLNRVIPGWTEGLQLIGEGGKIKLFVPSALGYGERGTQGIEPNSTLIFEVEAEKVAPYVEPADTTATE